VERAVIQWICSDLFVDFLLDDLHDGVELAPGDLAIAVEVDLLEGLLDILVGGSLVRGNVDVDIVVELVEVDVAVTVGVNVLEDEGGPLGGALDEGCELVLGDATIAVGINDLIEGVDLGVIDDLALKAGGGLELGLGDLAVTVGVKDDEHLIDLSLGLVWDEGLKATEDVGGEEGLDLIDVGIGDLLLLLLGELVEGNSLWGVVVDYGVVELGSGDHGVAVSIEWADEIPELLATALNSLGVGDQARPVGITKGHNLGGVSGPVVASERLSVLKSRGFLSFSLSSTSLSLEEAEEVAFGLGDGDESDDDEGCDFLEHIYLLIFIYYKFL